MNISELIISRFRLFISTALILTVMGAVSWKTMPRQEDPAIPARVAMIITPFPGATAGTVERLVVEPLESALSQVDDIRDIVTTARANVAVTTIELRDNVRDVGPVYDEVERRLAEAQRDFPENALTPELFRDIFDQESILISINGSEDPMELVRAAELLERRLLAIPDVSRTIISGDPGEQVTVSIDDATATRLGLDPRALAGQLAARNAATPGGTIAVGGRVVAVQPGAEYTSVEELAQTPILLPSGSTLPLSELARVSTGPVEPLSDLMRWNGARAVAIGVVPREGVNLIAFGEDVAEVVSTTALDVAPLTFDYIAFQPDQVEERLSSLGRSLVSGVAIVALFLFLFMGLRLGATVASIVPLVTLSSLGLYALAGGLLHQISIAALVLALGLLVDNAIVVAENVQMRIDRGTERWTAARDAISELALPLGAATGTTLAAFVPMLLAPGDTGDFTRALPIVIMLTLVMSYVFAITVTPALSAIILRPRKDTAEGSRARPPSRPLRWLSSVSVDRPWRVLAGVVTLLACSLALAPGIRTQFFPASDRNQVIVDVTLPEGTHLAETDRAAREIESALLAREDVETVATFVGRGVPHFYYNLPHKPSRPHLAQLIVTTTSIDDVHGLIADTRALGEERLPGVEVIARRIEQGPPVAAPVEFRVYGDTVESLQPVVAELTQLVRATPGAVDVRNDLGLGTPTLRFAVDDAIAGRHGLSRNDVAVALLGQTRGLEIGQFRAGTDPVPIVVRGGAGEYTSASRLASTQVSAPGVPATPLMQLALSDLTLEPSAVAHRNRRRVASVFAQVDEGATYSDVLDAVWPSVAALELPPGVEIEIGGEAEASGDSNAALAAGLPVAMMLLLMFLMGEFNSFRSVTIVMTTVPLAAVGVLPGLAFTGEPFGFMSLLGVFALIGIVVNNAIVLLDVIATQRREGLSIADAVRGSVLLRTRPILLTTGTTIMGLLPLALSASTFWPPLAWSMISGLSASTLLTLFAVPALYRLMHRDTEDALSLSAT